MATGSSSTESRRWRRPFAERVASLRMRVSDLLDLVDRRFPFSGAASWDPVGLQIGGTERPVGLVAVCHEVSAAVVDRVEASGIDTVISYHPLLFTPTTSFVDGPSPSGRALRLAAAGANLVVVHTAMDAAEPGTGDELLAALGYETSAAFGANGDEEQPPMGRVARLGAPESPEALAAHVAEVLATSVRTTAPPPAVSSVAVLPGSGAYAIEEASSLADVLITGDVSHHRAQRAVELGLMVIDAGHAATERPGISALYDSVVGYVADAELMKEDPNPWEG